MVGSGTQSAWAFEYPHASEPQASESEERVDGAMNTVAGDETRAVCGHPAMG